MKWATTILTRTAWVKSVPLSEAPSAFADLDQGRLSSSKVVLIP